MSDNPHRRAMLAWAEELDASTAPMAPLVALEVRRLVAKGDEEDKTAFMANLPNPDDAYHHWHTRAGAGLMPSCSVCQNTSQEDPQ